jgi:hypothetical protein
MGYDSRRLRRALWAEVLAASIGKIREPAEKLSTTKMEIRRAAMYL